MARRHRYPDRMQNSALTSRGTSTEERVSAAPSSTAPAAVIHEWSGCDDRKNATVGCDVWDASTSTNHRSHSAQTSWISGSRPSCQYRQIISRADGGEPARTSSAVIPTSLREKAASMLGRYVTRSAS